MSLPFPLLPVANNSAGPVWCRGGFQIGDEHCTVLQYSENNQGWNDELTHIHEESAGEDHFIDCASRDHAIAMLKQYLPIANPTILEVGCSSGYLIKQIKSNFPNALLMGADVVIEPLQRLAELWPEVPFFRFDLTRCPLPDQCTDAVVILNVLEHIENDLDALSHIYRILKPGGIVIIEVPAGQNLYDVYDKIMMHYRRYSAAGLEQITQKAGFQRLKQSHLGFFVFPGFWLVKQRNKRFLKESVAIQNASVKNSIQQSGKSRFLNALMRFERMLGQKISFPFGIRCLLTCKKPS